VNRDKFTESGGNVELDDGYFRIEHDARAPAVRGILVARRKSDKPNAPIERICLGAYEFQIETQKWTVRVMTELPSKALGSQLVFDSPQSAIMMLWKRRHMSYDLIRSCLLK
jgi:hypothetical protein